MKIVGDYDLFPRLQTQTDITAADQSNSQFKRRSILGNWVSLSVEAARSSGNLSLLERRLLTLAISKVDSRTSASEETRQRYDSLPQDERTVVVNTDDYAELTGTRRDASTKLSLAVDNILSKQLTLHAATKTIKINYLSAATYYPSSGEVVVVFNSDFLNLITNLSGQKRFIKYRCKEIKGLNIHAINLLELLKTYIPNKPTKITNIALRQALNAVDKYKSAKDLRVQVLEPAVKELSSNGWSIDFTAVKQGRRVTGYQFIYSIPVK
jgi:plasmid replication initiation protein